MSRAYLTFNPALEIASAATDVKSLLEGDSSDAEGDSSSKDNEPMPLQNEWKIWEQLETDNSSKDYSNSMKPIFAFNTVQDFWKIWNELPQPSQLMSSKRMVRMGVDEKVQMVDGLMVFRDNIKPMWEDRLNQNGGHFEIRYNTAKSAEEKARLDEHWNNLVLGIVGSTIEPAGMITGVRLIDKLHAGGRGSGGFLRIEIWFTDTDFPDCRQKLKQNIEKALATRLDGVYEPDPRLSISVKSHLKSK